MKIYISLDMEGLAGTFDWRQEDKNKNAVKQCFYQQMEWVLEGIQKSKVNDDITEIVIADSHASGDNLDYSFTAIDDRISLISGTPRPEYMMPNLDDTYDMVFFVGYHAGVGTPFGAMDHTYSGAKVHNIWINDRKMNESLLNAGYAGYYDIPVALVIGDDALGKELNEEDAMPWVKYVSTKKALGKLSSKFKPINVIKEETIKAVQEVLNKDPKSIPVYKFNTPIDLKIEFTNTAMADSASLMPYAKRIDGRTIGFTHDDYKVVFNAIISLLALANY
jgi:D-amino peptidase